MNATVACSSANPPLLFWLNNGQARPTAKADGIRCALSALHQTTECDQARATMRAPGNSCGAHDKAGASLRTHSTMSTAAFATPVMPPDESPPVIAIDCVSE
eukprot:COSAG02_NODE_2637_length_8357_cov_7.120974_15_plen_102_part_00